MVNCQPMEGQENYSWKGQSILKERRKESSATGWTIQRPDPSVLSLGEFISEDENKITPVRQCRQPTLKRKYTEISSSSSPDDEDKKPLRASFETSTLENGRKVKKRKRTTLTMPKSGYHWTPPTTRSGKETNQLKDEEEEEKEKIPKAKSRRYRRVVTKRKPQNPLNMGYCALSLIPNLPTLEELKELVAKYYKDEEKAQKMKEKTKSRKRKTSDR